MQLKLHPGIRGQVFDFEFLAMTLTVEWKTGTDLFNRYRHRRKRHFYCDRAEPRDVAYWVPPHYQSLAFQTPFAVNFDLIEFKSMLPYHKQIPK